MIYVILDSEEKVVWINPHPHDGLSEKEAWADFDPEIHTLARSPFFPQAQGLPWGDFDRTGEPHFKVEAGRIREYTLEEKYAEGIIPRPVEPEPEIPEEIPEA